jgi:hypothetical protein
MPTSGLKWVILESTESINANIGTPAYDQGVWIVRRRNVGELWIEGL